MEVSCEYIDYKATGSFSKIITDYISHEPGVAPFFNSTPDIQGIKQAIENRKTIATDRSALVDHLKIQYANISLTGKVAVNIDSLLSEQTFTVCTAHQPNIFTGHLYFIYKILHTIKLADTLKQQFPENNFVPVFYMGNEDADLEELGHIYINGVRYDWKTKQTGAVGKMIVDQELVTLISNFSGQVAVQPFGNAILEKIKACYVKGISLQEATLRFIHELFSAYGLIVLIPDSALLKRSMIKIFEEDLFNNSSFHVVEKTNTLLKASYKVQAQPREINLFYIDEQVRSRIIKNADKFIVENTDVVFTAESLKETLKDHPEKFSPNVILRGIYQETILPNLAFIGGGGEIAYWLQLKELFNNYGVPYPVLLLRNSFLIVDKKSNKLRKKLHLSIEDIFKHETTLINDMVTRLESTNLSIEKEQKGMQELYASLQQRIAAIDSSLSKHILSLEKRAIDKLGGLQKKMLRAEKRKYADQQNQLHTLKSILFPDESLQERVENVIPFYAKWGDDFFKEIYDHSLTFEQKFAVIEEN